MKTNTKLLIVGLACLGIGFFLGYCIKQLNTIESDFYVLDFFDKTTSDQILKPDEAKKRVSDLRRKNNIFMKTKRSWTVKRSTFESILAQIDPDGNQVDSIQFFPAFDENQQYLTILMAGIANKRILFKKKKNNDINTLDTEDAEFWDYIGPCPPKQNCPENIKDFVGSEF